MSTKPYCLHVPKLTAGENAKILWKDVGASQYELDVVYDKTFEEGQNGLSWYAMDSLSLTWRAFEEKNKTWRELEWQPELIVCFSGQGTLCPGPDANNPGGQRSFESLESCCLTWSEIEARNMTWQAFETLPGDIASHQFCIVSIPNNIRCARFRLRACDVQGNWSAYLSTGRISVWTKESVTSKAQIGENIFQIDAIDVRDPDGVTWFLSAEGDVLTSPPDIRPSHFMKELLTPLKWPDNRLSLQAKQPFSGAILWSGSLGRAGFQAEQTNDSTVVLERTEEKDVRLI